MGILDIFKACAKNRESSDTLSRDNYSAWMNALFNKVQTYGLKMTDPIILLEYNYWISPYQPRDKS